MPNLAQFHPQIVHFVVALLLVGVGARIVSLSGRLKFTDYGATTLVLLGTIAAVLAVKSGTDAHGPVERIPGTRELVTEHEEDGQRTRNIFLGVATIELIALAFARWPDTMRYATYARFASALVGVFGSVSLFETAEHGGELVYSYGGGPGLRTGDPQDVQRLLIAGLYNQAQLDRRSGNSAEAAALIDQLAARAPNDTNVRLLRVESLAMDRKDYRRAMGALDSVAVPESNARLRTRVASLKADIYVGLGKPDSAQAVLAPIVAANPNNARLKAKLDSIK
jgi:uncharacterized membrane protein